MNTGSLQTGRPRGFSMIELVVVLAIVGIMMLAMVPAVQERTTRKQIEEALELAQIAQTPIATSWALTQKMPSNNDAAALPDAKKVVNTLVSSLEVDNGAIHITFGNQSHTVLHGKVVTLRPAVVEGSPVVPVAWVCGNAEPPSPMRAMGSNRTNIQTNLLPWQCRGPAKS